MTLPLKGDMILGLVGSIAGGWIFRTMGVSPEAGMAMLVVVAFGGAALVIVGLGHISAGEWRNGRTTDSEASHQAVAGGDRPGLRPAV